MNQIEFVQGQKNFTRDKTDSTLTNVVDTVMRTENLAT